MLFRILHDEASGEITYLLADADVREAVLVDPHSRDLPVLQALLDERADPAQVDEAAALAGRHGRHGVLPRAAPPGDRERRGAASPGMI